MEPGEPNFSEDLEDAEEAIHEALEKLTEVKAYTFTPNELRDLKAAQYALRNISDEHKNHDVTSVYEE